ncbi:hypothetical protein [Noviherbaspirillum suwonense]|uniref:hypothetical protein n=1 Tax=Noviherbaspirillum suwonense TaxID=1224511 RepID=UPI0024B82DD8|nr:hypothetical protein [Noviherbaspirillum suwonense]
MSCAEAQTAPPPLFENILERQYRICLAYGLLDRFLPILNDLLQALGEGCLVLDGDLRQCLRAAHLVLKLTPEGLRGQRGQLLLVLGLERHRFKGTFLQRVCNISALGRGKSI